MGGLANFCRIGGTPSPPREKKPVKVIKFLFWDGVIWAMKEIYLAPLNYVQNHHLQRCENMKFIFNSQNAFIYH